METANFTIDFGQVVGKMKPMHGMGQPPMTGVSNEKFHYLKEAGIPYSRLHDVEGWLGGGLYVDIPNLFRDFDADENDPASYDFAFTDKLMEGLMEAECEPYFRLGVTIENQHLLRSYRIFPPKDPAKWARICEHVIRHYREGWANGYHYDITYWEIWNEPENPAMWKGTPEQFYELYAVTAKHLKACFGDTIKVGGYGHCGLYEFEQDKELNGLDHEETYIYESVITFMHGFFRHLQETGAPIDFFTWHVYDNCHISTKDDFRHIAKHAEYARKILDRYGYTDTEHHLNEWNLWTKKDYRDEPIAAAKSLSFMLLMQNTSTDVMCFYDGGFGYSDYRALINPDTGFPYRNYYAFTSFNTLYRLGNQVLVEGDQQVVCAGAAVDGRKAAIVMANASDEDVEVQLDIRNFTASEVQVLRTDRGNRYTLTGEQPDGKLQIPAHGCVELKLWDLA